MAKFYGAVGYGETVEIRPGVTGDVITEHNAYGDVLRNSQKSDTSTSVNGVITVGHSISIMADEYANNHLSHIRYVTWAGVRWKVGTIEVQYPRIILGLGGVYNGQTPPTPSAP